MAGLPAFLNINDMRVLVVGGGKVARRKINALIDAGAEIVVISPEIESRLNNMVEGGLLEWRPKRYENGDLEGFWLVIAATSDSEVNYQIYEEARELIQLYNIADRPDLSTFYTTARVKQGDLQIAISTGGKAPALSGQIRKELEERFGASFQKMLKEGIYLAPSQYEAIFLSMAHEKVELDKFLEAAKTAISRIE